MIKKLTIAGLAMATAVIAAACGSDSESIESNLHGEFEVVDIGTRLNIYIHSETGCHYMSGTPSGFTPLLNEDGTIYCKK